MSKGKRVAIYCRISRDDEGEALGVERQRQDCMKRADREGWTVVDVVIENDVSAAKPPPMDLSLPEMVEWMRAQRPRYADMIDRAEQGEFDIILAYSNSRLTRRPLELEGLIRLHEAKGTLIRTIVSGDDDLSTADGQMVARVKAAVDQAEAKRVSERVRRKVLERLERGLDATGGQRPFGYESDRLTIREDEAEFVRRAADEILAGRSVTGLANEWNQAGAPRTVTAEACARGKHSEANCKRSDHKDCKHNCRPEDHTWTMGSLSALLRSPRIAGLVSHKGKIVGDAQWPEILDRDTWERLQTRLSNGGHGNGQREQHMLAGMLYCAECGAPMAAGGQAGAYRCNRLAKTPTGGKPCGKVSRNIERLEQHVVAEWARHMERATGTLHFSPELSAAISGTEAETERLTTEREEITRRIKKTRNGYATGVLDDEDFFPVIGTLRARLAEIDRELERVAKPLSINPSDSILKTALELQRSGHVLTWEQALDQIDTVEGKREYLSRYIDRIDVGKHSKPGSTKFDPNTVKITWREQAV